MARGHLPEPRHSPEPPGAAGGSCCGTPPRCVMVALVGCVLRITPMARVLPVKQRSRTSSHISSKKEPPPRRPRPPRPHRSPSFPSNRGAKTPTQRQKAKEGNWKPATPESNAPGLLYVGGGGGEQRGETAKRDLDPGPLPLAKADDRAHRPCLSCSEGRPPARG